MIVNTFIPDKCYIKLLTDNIQIIKTNLQILVDDYNINNILQPNGLAL